MIKTTCAFQKKIKYLIELHINLCKEKHSDLTISHSLNQSKRKLQ